MPSAHGSPALSREDGLEMVEEFVPGQSRIRDGSGPLRRTIKMNLARSTTPTKSREQTSKVSTLLGFKTRLKTTLLHRRNPLLKYGYASSPQ